MMKRFALLVAATTLCVLVGAGQPMEADGALPAGWSVADIGDVGQPAQASESFGRFTVSGAGVDIWDTADAFAFAYRTLSGTTDTETITVRVESETEAESFAKAGLMIRQSLDPSAPHVILDVRPGGEVEFMTRETAGGPTRFIAGTTVAFPVTLILQRQTGAVLASVIRTLNSSGGAQQLGSTPFFRGPLFGGLAVNSHDRDRLNTAIFDHPSFSTGGLWNFRDVGDVGRRGGTSGGGSGATDTFSIDGAGDDIWGTADAFHFAYKRSSGDVDIVARLISQTATETFAKAALMMRAATNSFGEPGPADPHVILGVRPDGNVEFMTRPEASSETIFLAGGTATYPGWLRLVRTGNRFEGFTSTDGSGWRSIGATTMTAPVEIETGLAVTSHDRTVLNRARFDSIVVTAGAPQPADVVMYASDIPDASIHGAWSKESDPSSPNGVKLATTDTGLANGPVADPMHFVDATFEAPAGTPYTIWLRLQALNNSKFNDSVWVQFSDALVDGTSMYQIGAPNSSDAALLVNLATDGSGDSLRGWGWQQTAYWLSQPTTVTFASSGTHTIRVQIREDGVQLDQIVLSPARYLRSAPGPATGDTTIVPKP